MLSTKNKIRLSKSKSQIFSSTSMYRYIEVLLLIMLCIIFPIKIKAQVVINEFQISPSSDQWIELYNKSEDSENISGWIIDDNGGSSGTYIISPDTYLLANKCISFKGTFNWNISSQDSVRLIQPSGTTESYTYSKSPGDNISIGRIIDGEGDLVILGSQSKDKYNSSGESCLGPISSNTPTPTPTPTATTSYKAVCKINTPVDGDGKNLSDVQIYVDGNYVHHEDDETIYFFNGHECYSGIECGLGTHTISLRKSGYESWEDTEDFAPGMDLEVNPVLKLIQTPTPTAMVQKTLTPKPTLIKTSTPSVEIESSESATYNSPGVLGVEDTQESKNSKVKLIFPIFIILLGIVFIAFSIFSIIRNAKRENSEVS